MLHPDDPRVTAAALGELLPEEQAAFDRELAELAEPVRAEIKQIMQETKSLATRVREVRQTELKQMEARIESTGSDDGTSQPNADRQRISQQVLAQAIGNPAETESTSPQYSRGKPMPANNSRGNGWKIALSLAACVALVAVGIFMFAGPDAFEFAMNDEAVNTVAPSDSYSRDEAGFSEPYANSETSNAAPSPSVASSEMPDFGNLPASAAGQGVAADDASDGHAVGGESNAPLPPGATNQGGYGGQNQDGDRSGSGGTGGGSLSSVDAPLQSAGRPGDAQQQGGGQDQRGSGQGREGQGEHPEEESGSSESPAATNAATWKRSPLTPNASRLMIGDNRELPLEGMQANVQIDGYRARVLLDLYFFNDSGSQREADFRLRLPPEASLYYFAFGETVYASPQSLTQAIGSQPAFFNIERARQLSLNPKRIVADRGQSWIQPKEARMVQREKAAFAYGETVRRRVDPALVEWAGAGIFTARVFPVQPNKLHRIVVGYDVNLTEEQGDLVYRFAAPYAKEAMLDLRIARMDGVDVSIKPEVEVFADDSQRHFRVENPDEIVELRMSKPGNVMLIGEDGDGGNYFSGRFTPELPAVAEMKTPRDAIFLLDTSLSANPDRFNVYLQLLETMLKENRSTMPRFGVLFFSAHHHWWKESLVENTDDNVAALMSYANTLALEGATDLSNAAFEAVNPGWLPSTESQPFDYFLLSDGAMTWGERNAREVANTFAASGNPLFAYTTNSAGDDVRTLGTVTSATGGAVFSIVAEDQVTKVAKAHLGRPWELVDVFMPGGSDVMLAGNPQTLFPGVALQVVGRVNGALDNELTMQLRRGTEEQTIKVPFSQTLASDMASRSYGQVAVAGLEEFVSETESMATAYARHFRITGQTCSLLMLESQEDYDRFDIDEDDDAYVVTENPAAPLIGAARTALVDRGADSKANFVAWMQRLKDMPGLKFDVPQSLETMLSSLPAGAFQVRAQPLQPKFITWDQLPAKFQDAELSAEYLNYNEISAEADRRFREAGPDDALVALSSLVENNPGDFVLLRDVAYSALEFGRADQAFLLFRKVAEARPYEPQTYHAMARCAETLGNVDLAMLYYEVSVRGDWQARFGEFRKIAGLDYLRLLKQVDAGKVKSSAPTFAAARLNSVNSEFGVGLPELVITMAWNTDNTDVDLHVTDPTGEECFYSHPDTRIGGHLTSDVTQGFGPEMFVLRKAVAGSYSVRAHYFASDANREGTRTRVFLRVYQDWGTENETVNSYAINLSDGKEMHEVATVIVK